MKWYIAARYEKREEIKSLARVLHATGHITTQRWPYWEDKGLPAHDFNPYIASVVADMNLADIRDADGLILLTEKSGTSHGGRYVEWGYAMALGKTCIRYGEPENVFQLANEVYGVMSEDSLIATLNMLARLRQNRVS